MQMVARCKEDIIKAKGVKPTLSPNLNTLATVEALDVKKLLFIGVGCQVCLCHTLPRNCASEIARIVSCCSYLYALHVTQPATCVQSEHVLFVIRPKLKRHAHVFAG